MRKATYRWENFTDEAGARWVIIRDLDPRERGRPWCWKAPVEVALAKAFWKSLQDETAARGLSATFIRPAANEPEQES